MRKGIFLLCISLKFRYVSVMPIAPMLVFSALEWVVEHHNQIPGLMNRSAEFLHDVVTRGGVANTIRRVGNTIVWNRPDGGAHVIGMLDQIDSQIESIQIAQRGLQSGLVGLKSLSMVTLGFSAVAPVLILAQFAYLKSRFDRLQKEVKKVQRMINLTVEAELKTGLDALQQAEHATGANQLQCYHEALQRARHASHYFSDQARDPAIHEDELPVMQFLARKYFHALCIEIASLIGRGESDELKARINREETDLKTIAAQIYKQTLEKDIEYFLAPEFKDVATLENITDLLQQAKDLGCLTSKTVMSPVEVFEENRQKIYSSALRSLSPGFLSFKRNAAMRLHTAQGTFEEIIRILSWRESVSALAENNLAPLQVAQQLQAFKDRISAPTASAPFIAYSLSPS